MLGNPSILCWLCRGEDLSLFLVGYLNAALDSSLVWRVFAFYPETRRGLQPVNEQATLSAKQLISPSHCRHYTSWTHPSLLTCWRVSFIKRGLARASRVCECVKGEFVCALKNICVPLAVFPSASEGLQGRSERWKVRSGEGKRRGRGWLLVEYMSNTIRSEGGEERICYRTDFLIACGWSSRIYSFKQKAGVCLSVCRSSLVYFQYINGVA